MPTATINIMAAMARHYPSLRLLISASGSVAYQDLSDTRDTLGTEYFFTSKAWTPKGSTASLVMKGLQNYVADRNLAQALEVKAIGPDLDSDEIKLAGNFGVTKTVPIHSPSRGKLRKTVTTPSLDDPIIQRSYLGGGVTIQDIQQALDEEKGVLLALIYNSETPAGHAVSAVSLDWNDRNGNGLAEAEENAVLTMIDPLNPSMSYGNAIPGKAEDQQRFNPLGVC